MIRQVFPNAEVFKAAWENSTYGPAMKRMDTVYEPFAADAEAAVELQVRFDRVFSKPSKLDSYT